MCSGRYVALALCPVGFMLSQGLHVLVALGDYERFAGVQLSQVVKIAFPENIIKYVVITIIAVVLIIAHGAEVVADAVGGNGNNSRRVAVVVGAAVAHDDCGGAGVGVRGFNGFPCLFDGKRGGDALNHDWGFKVKSDFDMQSFKDCRVHGLNGGSGFIVQHCFYLPSIAVCDVVTI